jgi:hypothetical protein
MAGPKGLAIFCYVLYVHICVRSPSLAAQKTGNWENKKPQRNFWGFKSFQELINLLHIHQSLYRL